MLKSDLEWVDNLFLGSSWLFYGEFEEYLNEFLKEILNGDFKEYGFNSGLPNHTQVAYWSVISEMVSLNLLEYGTSPRCPWLTQDGERFASIILSSDNALREVSDYIYGRTDNSP